MIKLGQLVGLDPSIIKQLEASPIPGIAKIIAMGSDTPTADWPRMCCERLGLPLDMLAVRAEEGGAQASAANVRFVDRSLGLMCYFQSGQQCQKRNL